MKKNKIYKYISCFLGLTICLTLSISCTDSFSNFNRDPGQPTDEEIQEGNYRLGAFFPQMINFAYPAQENAYQMGENLIGGPYGRYLSIANNNFTASFSTFNAPASWINYPFNETYSKIYGGWAQIKANTNGEGPLFAWAQIIRITGMLRMTDIYGPIPYSKIEGGSIAVPYDSQEEAYKNMFTDLNKAITVLTQFTKENPDYQAMERFDNVYAGDFSKWIKYANSLKLRMAIRIVYADSELAKKMAEEAVKHEVGVMVSNSDIALCGFPSNPIWTMTTSWGDSRACADIIAYMNGYNDPRLEKYFTLSKVEGKEGKYHGLRTGITIPSKDWSGNYSSTQYKQSDPTPWMAPSEVAFLKAEGALHGWDMGGTVKDLYEEGIRLSFEQWGAQGENDYLVNDTSIPGDYDDPDEELAEKAISTITIKWDDNASFETKLERLITQKWIAMYPHGTEAWCDQRRTGYPYFFPVLVNSNSDSSLKTKLASRIPFPPDEQANNQANYNEAVRLLGGPDDYGTRLWWDQKQDKP